MEVSPVLATQPILARLFHGGLLDIIKSSSIDHFPGGFTTVSAAYKWAWVAERCITQLKPLTGSNHTNTNPTVAVVERPRTSTSNNCGPVHATGGREPNCNNNGRDRRAVETTRVVTQDVTVDKEAVVRTTPKKGRRPMGTPTGILYLWKDEQGVRHVKQCHYQLLRVEETMHQMWIQSTHGTVPRKDPSLRSSLRTSDRQRL
ncbi:hypothetical protein PROFUN_16120 [Planoprotostelium fungivorum]|uniref:Uncharacterized protein n=1 Tax=Planoprotostelium fungivorum TaxID=1890364 RepID=A0A2P6MSL6_9EUKA|nr:hypothetical protein PROFUN_16120 [Planoprotostelium fungivorum]